MLRATRVALFPSTTLFRSLGELLPPLRGRQGLVEQVARAQHGVDRVALRQPEDAIEHVQARAREALLLLLAEALEAPAEVRSEEHTSELQSRENLVCRLLP